MEHEAPASGSSFAPPIDHSLALRAPKEPLIIARTEENSTRLAKRGKRDSYHAVCRQLAGESGRGRGSESGCDLPGTFRSGSRPRLGAAPVRATGSRPMVTRHARPSELETSAQRTRTKSSLGLGEEGREGSEAVPGGNGTRIRRTIRGEGRTGTGSGAERAVAIRSERVRPGACPPSAEASRNGGQAPGHRAEALSAVLESDGASPRFALPALIRVPFDEAPASTDVGLLRMDEVVQRAEPNTKLAAELRRLSMYKCYYVMYKYLIFFLTCGKNKINIAR